MSHYIHKMNSTRLEETSFNVLYVTHSKYDKGWHSTSHTHHFTELFFILKGNGFFVMTDSSIPVKKNDFIIINPNVEHTERSDESNSLEYIALGVDGISFSTPQQKDNSIALFSYDDSPKDILFLLNKLVREIQQQSEHFDLISRNIVEILLLELQRAEQITIKSHAAKRLNQSVALVKYYIENNYRETITLEVLADFGKINKYYLAHRFKEEIGISPIEYLNKIRLKEADILLETTDYTIAEISEFCGFSSQSFFSQVFKREKKMSPSKYRKVNRLILT